MDRETVISSLEDVLDQTTDEILTSPVSPMFDSNYLDLNLGTSDRAYPMSYNTSSSLGSPNAEEQIFGCFPTPASSITPGSSIYDVPGAFSGPDWSVPEYISGAVPSSPYASLKPYSIGDLSPESPVGEADSTSCQRELFARPADGLLTSVAEHRPALTGSYINSAQSSPSKLGSSPPFPNPPEPARGPEGPRKKSRRMASPVLSGPASTRSTGSATAATGAGKGNKIQLRTASRKAKATRRNSFSSSKTCEGEEKDENDSLTPEERKARHSHNIVEKQYRNRLNAQFERLLACLPADQRNSDNNRARKNSSGSEGDPGGSSTRSNTGAVLEEKRVSKAEVLDLATKRIKILEKETKKLQEERRNLLQTVGVMTDATASRRGAGKG